MQSAQAMATDRVADSMREISISSSAPPAAPPAAAAATRAGGVEESKTQSGERCGTGEGEGEDDIDENDPLWKVSVRRRQ